VSPADASTSPPLAWSLGAVLEDVPAAGAVALAFLVLFAIAETVRRCTNVPVEVTRKGVHVGAGLVALALPHLFHSVVTLIALGLAFFGIMWLTRRFGLLSSVHQVKRRTTGAVVYPLAITALAILSGGKPVFYDLPLLILVLADPAASLGGTALGRTAYSVRGHRRTIEGSLAFMVMAFVASVLVLTTQTSLGLLDTLALAGFVSAALTVVEAWSVGGWDNMALPVVGLGIVTAGLSLDGGGRLALGLASVLTVVAAGIWIAGAVRADARAIQELEP
jgi:phytol kinase